MHNVPSQLGEPIISVGDIVRILSSGADKDLLGKVVAIDNLTLLYPYDVDFNTYIEGFGSSNIYARWELEIVFTL